MTPREQAPALSVQLQHTAHLLDRVMQGESTTALLAGLPSSLRPGIQALLLSVLRHAALARAASTHLVQKPPARPVMALLQTTLALMNVEPKPYPDHTLVNQAIEAAKNHRSTRHAAGLINACLRRWLREADSMRQVLMADPTVRWNLPGWWIERLRADHGRERAQAIMQAYRHPAPMTLRVNARWGDAQQLMTLWEAEGIAARITDTHCIELSSPRPVSALPGFAQGWCSVQDWAAQLAAPLLMEPPTASGPDARWLDACAAPGGKTAHLLELGQAQVWAVDQDPKRVLRIEENLRRIQAQAQVKVADAARPHSWWDGKPFDAILLDAPCTASGIVRRHPDVPWLRRESDVAQLAAQQKQLLHALWPLLKPGGVLVYCTCSVFKAEGENQIQTFVQRHNQAQRLSAPGYLFPQSAQEPADLGQNEARDHDGFFYARLRKLG